MRCWGGQERPFCNMRVAEGPVAGTLQVDGNLELDLGCRYRVPGASSSSSFRAPGGKGQRLPRLWQDQKP